MAGLSDANKTVLETAVTRAKNWAEGFGEHEWIHGNGITSLADLFRRAVEFSFEVTAGHVSDMPPTLEGWSNAKDLTPDPKSGGQLGTVN